MAARSAGEQLETITNHCAENRGNFSIGYKEAESKWMAVMEWKETVEWTDDDTDELERIAKARIAFGVEDTAPEAIEAMLIEADL